MKDPGPARAREAWTSQADVAGGGLAGESFAELSDVLPFSGLICRDDMSRESPAI